MTDSLDRESRLVRDTHMGHVKSNNIAQAHGNFGLWNKKLSVSDVDDLTLHIHI